MAEALCGSELLWCTDIHLNFLGLKTSPSYDLGPTVKRPGTPYDFGKELRKKYPKVRDLLVTGDISEGPSVERHLWRLLEGWGGRVFFVLGNHDYYHSSLAAVDASMGKFVQGGMVKDKLIWLRDKAIRLSPEVVLIGNEGWYDGRAASPMRSRIMMSDFNLIKEFRVVDQFIVTMKIREHAKTLSDALEKTLREVCEGSCKKVIVATHVPPFMEATFHEGQISDNDWLPWMCNVTLGDMLIQVAYEYPDVDIMVLCGHTHSPGEYKAAPNLRVFSGSSMYWYPRPSGTIPLEGKFDLLPVTP